ncbi:MAG: DUF3644 domain-containing protein [Caldilineaceae bacterium]|nr:DUF3644 domain-containing protein [Caldilineaceae bacterium]
MIIRKGRTKTILEAALDAALLAVEVYNKPRTTFRSEAYIVLMIIAWTRLFHAYFNATIGDRYYYRKKGSRRFERIDGEKKAWELATCIKEYGELPEPVKKNLEFFIGLRNRIAHRHIDRKEVDILIFGECQSLLFNFENTIVSFFGEEYALHESLAYSLQFSHLRKKQQHSASKSALSKDVQHIAKYVETYRSSLADDIFSSQEYSIKLLQIPKISNTNRSDFAIEFVRWDDLGTEDREAYDQIVAIIKDKRILVEAANVDKLKPSLVVAKVLETIPGTRFSMHTHTSMHRLFGIRPPSAADDPFDTNPVYCLYDEPHNDYLYTHAWVEFIIVLLQSGRVTVESIHEAYRRNEVWNIGEYE